MMFVGLIVGHLVLPPPFNVNHETLDRQDSFKP